MFLSESYDGYIYTNIDMVNQIQFQLASIRFG